MNRSDIIKDRHALLRSWFGHTDAQENLLDPNEELCWMSMLMGFCIASGVPIEDVRGLASYVHYNDTEVRRAIE